ncbi:hypothetical protein CDAR_387791 [Caerostris darwini]|uniref:Uncharacterized protein n=1 Tax=Caerostris darwini TaxID=1538125 RepID=A0AAV4SUW0_9ARAC|nr:hypothetical protein CDAR_387791 [Caerostris darwini]
MAFNGVFETREIPAAFRNTIRASIKISESEAISEEKAECSFFPKVHLQEAPGTRFIIDAALKINEQSSRGKWEGNCVSFRDEKTARKSGSCDVRKPHPYDNPLPKLLKTDIVYELRLSECWRITWAIGGVLQVGLPCPESSCAKQGNAFSPER